MAARRSITTTTGPPHAADPGKARDACLRYEIEKGLAGREPGSAPEFVAACHIYSPTLGTFQEALGPHRAEIVADVANYTDIAPIVQFSEIVGG